MRPGEDEPQYDPKHDKVEQAINIMELLLEPEDDFDLVLPESDCDNDDTAVGDAHEPKKNKKCKRKKSVTWSRRSHQICRFLLEIQY